MNDLEYQLRTYARALELDRPATRRDAPSDLPPAPRRQRRAFATAAIVLALVLLAGAALALRAERDPSAPPVGGGPTTTEASPPPSVVKTGGDLETRMSISDSEPGPGDTVTATISITNTGPTEIEPPCASATLMTSGSSPGFTGVERLDLVGAFVTPTFASPFSEDADQTTEPVTLEELVAGSGGEVAALSQKLLPATCVPNSSSPLAPGETADVVLELAVGRVGLTPGPGLVTGQLSGSTTASLEVPITIPEAPDLPVTESRALSIALDQDRVRAVIDSLPDQPQPLPGTDTTNISFVLPIDGGYQVGYAERAEAFLVTVRDDGTVASIETWT